MAAARWYLRAKREEVTLRLRDGAERDFPPRTCRAPVEAACSRPVFYLYLPSLLIYKDINTRRHANALRRERRRCSAGLMSSGRLFASSTSRHLAGKRFRERSASRPVQLNK